VNRRSDRRSAKPTIVLEVLLTRKDNKVLYNSRLLQCTFVSVTVPPILPVWNATVCAGPHFAAACHDMLLLDVHCKLWLESPRSEGGGGSKRQTLAIMHLGLGPQSPSGKHTKSTVAVPTDGDSMQIFASGQCRKLDQSGVALALSRPKIR